MYTLDSEDEAQHSHDYNDDDSTIGLHHPDIAREEERRRWERETAQRIAEGKLLILLWLKLCSQRLLRKSGAGNRRS